MSDPMTNLESLLERVKAATGPDRELDGQIEVQARRFDAYRAGLNDRQRAKWQSNGPTVYDGNTGYEAQRFTASVDAALALVERVLPGRWPELLESAIRNRWAATPLTPLEKLPRAIVAAALSALIAQGEPSHG